MFYIWQNCLSRKPPLTNTIQRHENALSMCSKRKYLTQIFNARGSATLLGNHRTESLKFDILTFGITVPLPDPWASTIGRWITIWSVPWGYSQSASVSHFRHFYIEMELWYLRIINRMNSTEKKIITSESHSTRYGLLHAYILFLLFTESSRRVLVFFLFLYNCLRNFAYFLYHRIQKVVP